MLRTRSPLGLPEYCYSMDLVRLACVKHAASVRPEPGSNSPTRICPAAREQRNRLVESWAPRVGIHTVTAPRSDCVCDHVGTWPTFELTDSIRSSRSPLVAARTGVQSSLPFSRSRRPRPSRSLGPGGKPLGARSGECRSWCLSHCDVRRVRRGATLAVHFDRINPASEFFPRENLACPSGGG